MFFIQESHKRLVINVSRIQVTRYNARKKIIGYRCNTTGSISILPVGIFGNEILPPSQSTQGVGYGTGSR